MRKEKLKKNKEKMLKYPILNFSYIKILKGIF